MCLYREFDHSRGGNDARYSEPAGGVVHDEVIVLSQARQEAAEVLFLTRFPPRGVQFWGDAVFHIYQEDFIRLGESSQGCGVGSASVPD